MTRTCDTCGTRTPHAYLLTDEQAETDERARSYPDLDDEIEEDLFELEVREAQAVGVTVSERAVAAPILVSVMQYLDDGVWEVCLDLDATAKRRRLGLQTALEAISNARSRKWFVVMPEPGDPQSPARFAVFRGPNEDSVERRPSAVTRVAGVDPDPLEPPTATV